MVMAPFVLALRRLHARRAVALGTALAVAAATGLLLAVSVLGALARADSARGRVAELAPRDRIVQVTARLIIGGEPGVIARRAIPRSDPGPAVQAGRRALAGLGLGAPATVLVGGPVSPADERGTRLVHVATGRNPRIVAGRAPRRCGVRHCEVVALARR